MTIGTVIPFYKNRCQLDKCIEHLKAQTLPVALFVYDNSDENIYFTAAINEGLRYFLKLDGDYIIILNQDMYLGKDAVAEMVKFMDSHPKCGIGMPLQLSVKNPNQVIFGGGVQTFPIGTTAVGPVETFAKDCQIRWADGGCMILRKEMIQQIGLFDENMKFVASDSDYCYTARSRGWQVWNIVKARGVHERGAAAEDSPTVELNLVKANDMDYYARKWLTGELYRQLSHPKVDCSPGMIDKELVHIRTVRAELEEINVAH